MERPEISIQIPEPERAAHVRTWTTFENIYVIGSRNGCGCDFPDVVTNSDGPLVWDWRSEEKPNPSAVAQVEALADLMSVHLGGEPFELWPIQDLTESERPWGIINLAREAFVPTTFYFNERFLYRVAGTCGAFQPRI